MGRSPAHANSEELAYTETQDEASHSVDVTQMVEGGSLWTDYVWHLYSTNPPPASVQTEYAVPRYAPFRDRAGTQNTSRRSALTCSETAALLRTVPGEKDA
jgi:hypothetical protein